MYRVIVRVRQQFADRTGLSSAIAQIVVDGALFDAERMSDFGDGELLLSQGLRMGRCGLGRARLAPGVNAAFFSQGNAEKQAGNHMPNRATEIDLLCDRNHPYSELAPIGQHVDAFPKTADQAVEFADYNRCNFAGKDRGL